MRKSTFVFALAFLVAIAWLGLQSNQPRAAEDAKPIMQKWEYLTENGDRGGDHLNKLGEDGWEMCGVGHTTTADLLTFFKRPKQ